MVCLANVFNTLFLLITIRYLYYFGDACSLFFKKGKGSSAKYRSTHFQRSNTYFAIEVALTLSMK